MRWTMLRRWRCCSHRTARGFMCFASRAERFACWMRTSYAVIKKIAVGRVPRGFSLSPKGDRLFVTNSWDDTLSVIDTARLAVMATWPVGAEPSGVVEDRAGKHLFVANRISNDMAVLDAQTGAEEKRLAGGRGASYLTLSPDGSRIYATHIYPNPPPLRTGLENRTAAGVRDYGD